MNFKDIMDKERLKGIKSGLGKMSKKGKKSVGAAMDRLNITDTCCICGKTIPLAFLADHLGEGEKLDGLVICRKCDTRLQEIRFARNIEKNAEYFNRFSPRIKNKAIREHIKKIIADGEGKRADLEQAKQDRKTAARNRQTQLREIILTSGSGVEGWRVTEYLGLVSTEVATGMGYFDRIGKRFSKIANPQPEPIWEILAPPRQAAINRLKVQGVDKGANAIIEVDFDYIAIGESILAIIVNGTAVRVERIEPEA